MKIIQWRSMPALRVVYGNTPRVRMLETIMGFAGHEFTASQAAAASDDYRPTAMIACKELLKEGILSARKDGRTTKYTVNEDHPFFQVASLSEAVLKQIIAAQRAKHSPDPILQKFRARVWKLSVDTAAESDQANITNESNEFTETHKRVVFA